MAKKLGIIGDGNVGSALARGLERAGHDVRAVGKDKAAIRETAAWAEVVLLAVPFAAIDDAVQELGNAVEGKTLIDVTNALDAHMSLAVGFNTSGAEELQRKVPKARVVKAFNTVGNAFMFRPVFAGGPPDMFFCGNDAAAKKTVEDILVSFGWQTVDLGGIESSRYLEALCMVWVIHGIRSGTWTHAFKLLRK